MEGTTTRFDGYNYFGENPETMVEFFDKYMTTEAIHWNRAKVVFYAIEPERIDYIDYSVGFGHRESWPAA